MMKAKVIEIDKPGGIISVQTSEDTLKSLKIGDEIYLSATPPPPPIETPPPPKNP